jgi:hypothetical protein
MMIRMVTHALSLAVMLTVCAMAADRAAAESRTKSSGAAEVKPEKTAVTNRVVRDHRGQPSNAAPPLHDPGWGNDGGANVRDHRKQPCLSDAIPGSRNSVLGLGCR